MTISEDLRDPQTAKNDLSQIPQDDLDLAWHNFTASVNNAKHHAWQIAHSERMLEYYKNFIAAFYERYKNEPKFQEGFEFRKRILWGFLGWKLPP